MAVTLRVKVLSLSEWEDREEFDVRKDVVRSYIEHFGMVESVKDMLDETMLEVKLKPSEESFIGHLILMIKTHKNVVRVEVIDEGEQPHEPRKRRG